MSEAFFSIEWTISEERLTALKNSTENEFLESHKYPAFSSSTGVQYYLRIFPNGSSEERRGQVGIYLYVDPGNQKEVKADYQFSSAEWTQKASYKFTENNGFGFSLSNFFDEDNKFISNGKCVIKVEGCLRIPYSTSPYELKYPLKRYMDLWKQGFEDFIICVGSKEINVHKNVLSCQSSVFAAMFNSTMKEGIENQVKIIDFSEEVVETAIKACYGFDVNPEIPIETVVSVIQFADKYDIAIVKDRLEHRLIENLDGSNVCEVINLTPDANVMELRAKSMEYVKDCMKKNLFVANIDLLERDVLVELVQNSVTPRCETA